MGGCASKRHEGGQGERATAGSPPVAQKQAAAPAEAATKEAAAAAKEAARQKALDEWRRAGADYRQLGITVEGAERFCRQFGFPLRGEPKTGEKDAYESKYERADGSWITAAFGNPYVVDYAYWQDGNLMGYDLGEFTRTWLCEHATKFGENGKPAQSVVEVLLEWGWPEVSVANAFYSHIQAKWPRRTFACMRLASDAYRSELGGDFVFWLDYLSLRQCQRDFDLVKVQELVETIGFTVVELDTDPQAYHTRSFCVLELFSTIAGKAKMCVTVNVVRALRMAEELKATPVDAKAAQTRDEEDKKTIDGFIEEKVEGGFEGMDRLVTKSMVEGATSVVEASRGMHTIDLSNCQLDGSKGDGDVVAQIIREFPALASLDLKNNAKLGAKGIEPISKALAENTTLTEIKYVPSHSSLAVRTL